MGFFSCPKISVPHKGNIGTDECQQLLHVKSWLECKTWKNSAPWPYSVSTSSQADSYVELARTVHNQLSWSFNMHCVRCTHICCLHYKSMNLGKNQNLFKIRPARVSASHSSLSSVCVYDESAYITANGSKKPSNPVRLVHNFKRMSCLPLFWCKSHSSASSDTRLTT